MTRLGFSVVSHDPFSEVIERILWAESVGFDDIWTAELPGTDPFIMSATALRESTSIRVGIGIAATTPRSATATAVSTRTIADISPGRFVLGLGTSSPQINSQWHGVRLASPMEHLREYTFQVRDLLTEGAYRNGDIRVRLPHPSLQPVPLYLGVLGPKMINLAAEVADGIVTVFVGPNWVESLWSQTLSEQASNRATFEVVTRVFLPIPGDEPGAIDCVRQLISQYAHVPAYAAHFSRMGYPDLPSSTPPLSLIEELVPLGNVDQQLDWLRSLAESGCGTIALEPVTTHGLTTQGTSASEWSMIREHLGHLASRWS